jgi:hypothetical protein
MRKNEKKIEKMEKEKEPQALKDQNRNMKPF